MTLNVEWRDRLDAWRDELKRHFYRPLGSIELTGFVTSEQLSPSEALQRPFKPMPAGTAWGVTSEYGWFHGVATVPETAAGERIVAHMPVTDKEALVWANGAMIESHRGVWGYETLTREATAGETFDLLVEAAACYGYNPCHTGPTPPNRSPMRLRPPMQQLVGECSFGVWNEVAYQLHIDVETLVSLRDALEADSLRVAEIDKALKQFTFVADFEVPFEQMQATLAAAGETLAAPLACRNGSTSPEFFCMGHAHLDVAWLWPLAETERKAARTLANQLALAEEYDGYAFMHSQPHLYKMVQRRYPELYERVKKAVADGTVIADGAMWVEADTNISGGESLIRQFLHGKRFFADQFGRDSRVLWLPDVFGYCGALPQIMRGCGVEFFSTTKVFWNYHGGETFPYHNFIWEGIDGSEVIVHLHHNYNSKTDAGMMAKRWNNRVQKDDMSTRLVPFGWGDGGGGPTRDHLEHVRRNADLEGVPRMRMATLEAFFADLVKRGEHDANRYVGELYFQAHRGVLTSQAKTKKGNRKCEFAFGEAEFLGAAAGALAGFAWPREAMDRAWEIVLLNQFHDILPGSSIERVHQEAEAAYAEALETAGSVATAAAEALTVECEGITVFNSLSWPRTALVELPEGAVGAVNAAGDAVPCQQVEGKTLAVVAVPSCGWTSLTPSETTETDRPGVTATESLLENDLLRVQFNATGEMVSLIEKATGREQLAGPSNVMKMWKDVPSRFDAWDIDSMYVETPVELGDDPATIEVVASGPLVGVLRVTRRLNESTLTQDISLQSGSRRVEFATTVDWRESHKMLKVCFTPDIHANEAIQEIQFGHIRRPNHASRQFDADRFEVCNHKWTALAEQGRGFAVLNDCKYGVNVLGKTIGLTLLRSPLAPDMNADKGVQTFTYAAVPWTGSLADSDVVREGYDLNAPLTTAPGSTGERSLLSIDASNVVVETVKPAEDGDGVIVRLYESMRTATACVLSTTLPAASACEADMLENNGAELTVNEGTVDLSFRPFEVKTLRLRMG